MKRQRNFFVSVLGHKKGYTVKYSPLPEMDMDQKDSLGQLPSLLQMHWLQGKVVVFSFIPESPVVRFLAP